MTITRAEAIKIFRRDLEIFERAVDAAITRPMQDHQRDAFVSIAFNIGGAAFKRATFVKRFNAGDVDGCAKAIMQWRKPTAIIPRREGERDQFLTPYISALPKARSTDKAPVKGTPKATAPAPRAEPVPTAPAPAPSVMASRSPGGLLSGFWALFQGKPPVKAAERASVVAETKAEAPSLSKELGGIRLAGFGTLLAGVAGGAQDSGLLDTVKGTADQATDTFQSVQQLVNLVFGLIRWAIVHWWIGAILIGVYLAVKVGWAIYKVYAQIQHTRAMEEILRKE